MKSLKLPKLIGVIHLPPLAGSPLAHGEHPAAALQNAGLQAVNEAQMLEKAGFDGVIIENFGDAPFYKSYVPPETVASIAIIAAAVREAVSFSVGINILRNDARAALAIAAVSNCDFIRVNVFSGVTATDQGIIEGDAAFIVRERERLGASHIKILADVHVKHGLSLSSRFLDLAIEENGLRAMADGVILTGPTTGRMLDLSLLQSVIHVSRDHQIPLYLGSGVDHENIHQVKPLVSGIIVGSALKKKGQPGAPLDPVRLKKWMNEYQKKKLKKFKK